MHTHQATPRADVGAPPAHAVEWKVSCGARSKRVVCQLWSEARAKGAALLGVNTDRVRVERLDEKKLPGKAVA